MNIKHKLIGHDIDKIENDWSMMELKHKMIGHDRDKIEMILHSCTKIQMIDGTEMQNYWP